MDEINEKLVIQELETHHLCFTIERQASNYEQALPIAREICLLAKTLGDSHWSYSNALHNLSGLYRDMGNYSDAELSIQEALRLRKKTVGEFHDDYITSLNSLAIVYYDIGNFNDAKTLFEKVIIITKVTKGEINANYAMYLTNYANLIFAMGKYTIAESIIKDTLILKEKIYGGKQHFEYAVSLDCLGGTYRRLKKYLLSLESFKEAEKIYRECVGEDHPSYGLCLNNFALLYRDMGEYSDAESLIIKSLQIKERTIGKYHLEYAMSLSNLATVKNCTKDYDSAENIFLEAQSIFKVIGRTDHPEYAASLNNLANLYVFENKYNDAEKYYKDSLDVLTNSIGEIFPEFVNYSKNLFCLYAATGNYSNAFSILRRALEIEDILINYVFSVGSEQQREEYLINCSTSNIFLLTLVMQHFSNDLHIIQFAYDFVLRRKCLNVEVLKIQQDEIISGRYPHLEKTFAELKNLRSQIAKKILNGPGKDGIKKHKLALEKLISEKARIESDLAQSIPEIAFDIKLRETDSKAILRHLPQKSMLIEYIQFENINFESNLHPDNKKNVSAGKQYIVFLLSPDKPDNLIMINLGDADSIDRLILDYHKQIEREGAGKKSTEREKHGINLRQRLFDPIKDNVGDITRLFISPDGLINNLPLETLPLDKNRYLIDEFHISYLTSGRDIIDFTEKAQGKTTDPIIIADPDFDLCIELKMINSNKEKNKNRVSLELKKHNIHFNRLNGTKNEGNDIADLMSKNPQKCGNPRKFFGKNALKKKIIEAAQSPRIVHFATHGWFLSDHNNELFQQKWVFLQLPNPIRYEENPLLRSTIILAGANTYLSGKESLLPPDAENGLLTAEDVTCLNLKNTELVVLSACDSGRGLIRSGEGVFGLRRAFVIAGAKTLVMSLWKVPDDATRELMFEYYQNLLSNNTGRSEALREAQLKLREKYQDVMSWGAFICQGNPGPV